MEKLVIALVGPPLSGKGILNGAIEDWCGQDRVSRHCTGDILRSVLEILGQPQDRPDCSRLVKTLVKEYGEDFLAKLIKNRILKDPRPIIIFDSMRLLADEGMILSLPVEKLTVYVTAPEEVRYKRLKERQRSGEERMSEAQFHENENLLTEQCIRVIGERANVTLNFSNDYPRNEIMRLDFCKTHLPHYAVSL